MDSSCCLCCACLNNSFSSARPTTSISAATDGGGGLLCTKIPDFLCLGVAKKSSPVTILGPSSIYDILATVKSCGRLVVLHFGCKTCLFPCCPHSIMESCWSAAAHGLDPLCWQKKEDDILNNHGFKEQEWRKNIAEEFIMLFTVAPS